MNISRIDGDGKIDDLTMLGTRSFTIWVDTDAGLTQIWASGSFFEEYIRDNDPTGWALARRRCSSRRGRLARQARSPRMFF